MTDNKSHFPVQGAVYTGIEFLTVTDIVTDADTNLVIGAGIKTADGSVGINVETGGFYSQKDDTYLIGYTSSGCDALAAMGSDQPCDDSDFNSEPVYGINSVHHENRAFAGVALALQAPKMRVTNGLSAAVSGNIGYRKVFFEDDVHIGESLFVEREPDDKLVFELGVTQYFDTPEQFGTPAFWIGAIAQASLDDESLPQVGAKAAAQFQF